VQRGLELSVGQRLCDVDITPLRAWAEGGLCVWVWVGVWVGGGQLLARCVCVCVCVCVCARARARMAQSSCQPRLLRCVTCAHRC
jgi:hypothetical protein